MLKITKAKVGREGASWGLKKRGGEEEELLSRRGYLLGQVYSPSIPIFFLIHNGTRMQFGDYLGHLTHASPFLMPFGEGGSVTGGAECKSEAKLKYVCWTSLEEYADSGFSL